MKVRYITAIGLWFALSIWLGSTGCEKGDGSISDNNNNNGSDSDADSDGDADGDDDNDDSGWEDDDDDDDDTDSGSEPICEKEEIEIIPKLSRLMILQDISGSMILDENEEPDTDTDNTKWMQAKRALTAVTLKFNEEVDFGLSVFPTDGNCSVAGSVKSDTLPLNAQLVIDELNAIYPEGATPLYQGLRQYTNASIAPIFTAKDAESFLILVSDGKDTCEFTLTTQMLTDITAQLLNDVEIKTVVIGFGKGADPTQLNAIAAAGGTIYDTYIDAQNEQELQDKLEEIIISLVSCTYQIEVDEPNVDPEKVNFYFITLDDDGNEVENLIPYDEDCGAGIGWHWVDFDNFIVEFCEQACETLQTGDVTKIIAEFGCDIHPV